MIIKHDRALDLAFVVSKLRRFKSKMRVVGVWVNFRTGKKISGQGFEIPESNYKDWKFSKSLIEDSFKQDISLLGDL